MKIRVLIVEDEPIIRTGLARVLPWESMGCEVTALAENGADGLKKAEECEPHLVISDIRMPKMDGLAMVEQIAKRWPDTQVVLLTGYKEFDYAKRAIEYGVSHYCLKPVDQDELLAIVEELVEKIRMISAAREEKEYLKTRVRDSLPILRDKFLSNLLFSSPDSIYHIYERMSYFSIQIHAFAVLAVEIDSFHELERGFTEDDIQILLFLIEEQMEELTGDYGYRTITFRHEKKVYAILGEGTEALCEDSLLEYGRALGKAVEIRGRFTVSVGISAIHGGAAQVRSARKEADKCTDWSCYLGAGRVVCYGDMQTAERTDIQEAEEISPEAFYEAVKQGGRIEEEALELCGKIHGKKNTALVKSIVAETVSKGFRLLLEEYGESQEILGQFDRMMERVYSARHMQNFEDIFAGMGEWIDAFVRRKRVSRARFIMDKAISYMKANCRREVSLEEVSEQLYVSKWYFSKLFHKETGTKFSDYMSTLRIEEAQRMIRENPGLKNYEVADRMGFGSVRYFSQLFKKVTGKTPSEYRG